MSRRELWAMCACYALVWVPISAAVVLMAWELMR